MFGFKKQLITSVGLFVFALTLTLVTTSSARAQDPGSTAFQDWRTLSAGDPVDHIVVGFQVPHGQRLVIERLTAEVSVPPKVRIVNTTLSTTVNHLVAPHVLPRAVPLSSNQGEDNYSFFLTPNVYADSPDLIIFSVNFSVPAKASLNVTISGHLVCPADLNCPIRSSLKSNSDDPAVPTQNRSTDAAIAAQTRPRFAKLTKSETVAMRIQ